MKKFLLISILFISGYLLAQSKSEKIDDLLTRFHEYDLFNGSALVAENGAVIFKKGYGEAVKEWDVKNSPDTKFRIGSISKQFTATIIMQLVEQGKISLDAKITDYLDDYRKDTGDRVSIHHLLTHTSGIPSYTGIPNVWRDSLRNHYEQSYFIKKFHSGDLEFEPGEKFVYNNTGYYLLAVIAEKVTGEPFGELLRKRIFEPVGMKNTGSEDDEKIIYKMANGYMKTGNEFVKDPYMYMPNAMGAGHMYSTVEDLYKWDQALYKDEILSAESKKKMFTPFLSNYGYGWGISKISVTLEGDSTTLISHTGGINGFNTLIGRLVDDKNLIVIFNNTGTARLQEMSMGISNILYDQEFDYPKKPIADHLLTVIEEEGIKTAVKLYQELKKEEYDSFDFAEFQLNTLGYTLLRSGKIDEAIEIFKLNIEAYPEAFNVYDSMGEAFMEKGETELAIENYKKSLEINPGNQNGISKLKELGVEWEAGDVEVNPETLNKYTGEYELFPSFTITIRVDGNRIFAQATGQPEFEIFPKSETMFYYKVVNAQIEFFEEDGEVNRLVLYQNNQEMSGARIK